MKNKCKYIIAIILFLGIIINVQASTDQIYKIDIEENFLQVNNSGITITPTVNVDNPLKFTFEIKYNANLSQPNCILKIKDTSNNFIQYNNTNTITLPNGNYEWKIDCTSANSSQSTTGTIKINEEFAIKNLDNKIYLYDLGKQQLYGGNTANIISRQGGNVEYTIERPSGNVTQTVATNHSVNIDKNIIAQKGLYKLHANFKRLEQDISKTKEFYAGQILFSHPTKANKGETVTITLDIDTTNSQKTIDSIVLDFGDGSTVKQLVTASTTKYTNNTIKHTYSNEGNVEPSLLIYIGGQSFTVTKGTINIESNDDNEDPVIDLISPGYGVTINKDTITFKFEVSDNVKLERCDFRIYNATYASGILEYNNSQNPLVYSEQVTQAKNAIESKIIEIELVDFEQRDYAWEVSCRDNASNKNFDVNHLRVNFNGTASSQTITSSDEIVNYERKKDVERLLSTANEFIAKEESWSVDEKEALNSLGIIEQVKYYKKRLLDIEQTLSKNLNFISDANLRETRRQETLDEIDTIQENLPTSFVIEEKYEFVKNGNTFNWEEIIQTYLDETKTKVSSSLANLIEGNKALQEKLTVSSKVKRIKIEYELETKEFVLVTKKVNIQNTSTQKILEIIPDSLVSSPQKIEIITDAKNYSNNEIIEINVEDIENDEIIYKIHENIDLKKIEDTNTILFSETVSSKKLGNTISGFLVFGRSGEYEINNALFFIILILVVIILVLWIIAMFKRIMLKRDPNTYRIFELIKGIKNHLKENNVTDAREEYKKIQEIYPTLSTKNKKAVIKKIKKANMAIDKKDIFDLVKEFRKEKMSGNENDAQELYEQIQKIYKRLEEKDRSKVIKGLQVEGTTITKKTVELPKKEIQEKEHTKEIQKNKEESFSFESTKKSAFY